MLVVGASVVAAEAAPPPWCPARLVAIAVVRDEAMASYRVEVWCSMVAADDVVVKATVARWEIRCFCCCCCQLLVPVFGPPVAG